VLSKYRCRAGAALAASPVTGGNWQFRVHASVLDWGEKGTGQISEDPFSECKKIAPITSFEFVLLK
jgi:hypothetical protein